MVKYPKLVENSIFEPETLMHSFYFSETLRKCEGNASGCNLNIPVPYNILDPVPGVFVGLKTTPFGAVFVQNFECYNLFIGSSLRCLYQILKYGCLKLLCLHIFAMFHDPKEINVVKI